MGYLITFVVALVGALLAMTAVGFFLPVNHTASGSGEFSMAAEQVFDAAVKLQEQSDVKARVTEELRPSRRVTEIIEEKGSPFGGTWTLELVENGTTTKLTITENGRVYNPLFRFLSRFTFGHRATIDAFLKSLKREVEQ